MSSMMTGTRRATREASGNDIVRRIVSLPRSLMGGFSRAMNNSIGLTSTRRNHNPPLNFQIPHTTTSYSPEVITSDLHHHDQWQFLANFEQNYGTYHPFFYACRFMEALKMARDEGKFVFVYLHSPDHPFTGSFCRGTLCSEVVVQFLDANFISWAAVAEGGEGLQMAAALQAGSFPFCAVVAPASGDNLAVLQQIEGPVSPAELVEILQRTMEEQGLAFSSGRAKEEEKRRADRRLREEQDKAYLAALKADQERERLRNLAAEIGVHKVAEAANKANHERHRQVLGTKLSSKVKETTHKRESTQSKDLQSRGHGSDQVTQILVRFPNGERREQSFMSTDKIEAIYSYIDSLGLLGVGSYRLVSSFPRKVYGVDQMELTLKEAGFHPRASLFLELL